MAQSTEWQMVPMIGLDNLVLALDGTTQTPAFFDNGGGYVYVSQAGDGSVPSTTVTGATGRTGSLKTAFQLIAATNAPDLVINAPYTLSFGVYIPPGVKGLVAGGATVAQLTDTANYPVLDVTLFNPLCFATPSLGLSAILDPREAPAELPLISASPCWGSDLSFAIGVSSYTPPQFYSGLPSSTLDPDSNTGQDGFVAVSICIQPSLFSVEDPNVGVTVEVNSVLQVVVDFSWTAGN
jgi:hypothetical protein